MKSHGYRAVAESHIGRTLEPGEVVHHINGDRLDNRPANLWVLSAGAHVRLHHMLTRAYAYGWEIPTDWDFSRVPTTADAPELLTLVGGFPVGGTA